MSQRFTSYTKGHMRDATRHTIVDNITHRRRSLLLLLHLCSNTIRSSSNIRSSWITHACHACFVCHCQWDHNLIRDGRPGRCDGVFVLDRFPSWFSECNRSLDVDSTKLFVSRLTAIVWGAVDVRLLRSSCSQQKQREDIYVLYRIHSDAIDIREE